MLVTLKLVNKFNIPQPSISIPSVSKQPTHEGEVKTFSLPQETTAQKLWRGFKASIPKEIWFVIVGSHLKFEDARRQAEDLTNKGFKAEVYAPYGKNPYYAVVIGANLTYREAERLRQKAIEAGLPRDTYLWRLE